MGVLDSILEYKRQKEAQANADIAAIPQGVNAFLQAREQARKSALDEMLTTSTLAKNQADILKAQNESQLLNQFLTGGGGGVVVPEANIGGFKLVNPAVQQQVQASEAETKNTADARKSLDEYMSNAGEALQALDKLEAKAKALGNFKRGVKDQALARVGMAAKKFGQDKSVNEFTQAISQEMAPLVRKLAEEKGPLTDNDIKRAIEGVGGDLTRPFEDKLTAINDLRSKVMDAIRNKSQIAKVSEEDLVSKYPNIMNRVSNAGKDNVPEPQQINPIIEEAKKKFPGKSEAQIIEALKRKGLL